MWLQTAFTEADGQFSPDGQWVSYSSDESGQFQICAAPFSGPGGKHQISSGGGRLPRWRRDGKEIFYNNAGQLMAAEVATRSGSLEVGPVRKLFDGIISNRYITYDATDDGQKFRVGDEWRASVQNWTASLRR